MVRVFISYRNNTLDIRCAIQQLILRSFHRYIFLTASPYTRFLRSHLLPNLSFPSLSFARPEMTKGKTKAVGNRGSRNAEMDDTRNRATLEEGESTRGAQLDAFVLSEAEDITRKRARGRG